MKLSRSVTALAVISALLSVSAPYAAVAQPAENVSTAADPTFQVERKELAKGFYEIAFSPSQNAVFVASSGGWGEGAQSKILRLNPRTLEVEKEILLDRKAFGVTLDDTQARLYVGNTVDLSVTVVDIANNRVVGVVQLEEKVTGDDGKASYPRDLRELAVDPVNNRLFLQGHSAESVLYVVDTEALRVEKIIPGLGGPKAPGLALDAAGQRLFVTNLQGELITISTESLDITKRVKTDIEQPLNVAFDPSTDRLFLTDQGLESIRKFQKNAIPDFESRHPGNRVVVLDAESGREIRSIPTEEGPMGILLDAPRQRLYVTNRAAGKVTVYDAANYALLETISLPTHPNSLALDGEDNTIFVSIKNGENASDDALESVARISF